MSRSRTTVTENQKWRREAALAGCRVMAAKIALPHRRRQGWRSTALEAMGIGRANVYRAQPTRRSAGCGWG
jgi:hypothetical protein